MFKIGDFSRLANVPVRTLHYYDQIGLFQPAQVDHFTGYRYYSYTQLPRLNRILALKELGFALEQISQIIDEPLSADELSGMLRLRRVELQSQINELQDRLARVEARLHQIRQEGTMSDYEIIIKNVPAQKIVGAREVIARPELMRERCIALMDAVEALLKKHNVTPGGPSLAIYHNNSEAGIDTEMALIVPADTPSLRGEHAAVRDLPGSAMMAATTYRGSYDDHVAVTNLHQSLARWIEESGYRPAGPIREIYVQVPGTLGQGASGVMELNWPVEKV